MIVGASGMIGQAVTRELGRRHDIVTAGRSSGDVRLDITDEKSIQAAFVAAGPLDAVVCTAGSVKFAPFSELDSAGFEVGLRDKLMGQVNLVLVGRESISDGGSFTLTTGVLDRKWIIGGSSASMVNGAVNAFVRAVAIEMPRGQRINAVSPGVIEEAMDDYGDLFRGFEPVPAAMAAQAYAESVEGAGTGVILEVD